jgi:hypothetical protein
MNFLYLSGFIYLAFAYQQYRMIRIYPNNPHIKNQYGSNNAPRLKQNIFPPKHIIRPLNLKLEIAESENEFHVPTESEIQTRQQSAELDQWFRSQFPVVYPIYIDCQTLTWDECVWQEGCSWCKWPTEGCQYTDVSYLLPTIERCVEGGVPIHPDQLPECFCGDIWFEEC